MKAPHRRFLQDVRREYGIHIVKQPMDCGFMLAVYTKDGIQLFHDIYNLPSETAYNWLYPKASRAVAQYFNLYGPYCIDPMGKRETT